MEREIFCILGNILSTTNSFPRIEWLSRDVENILLLYQVILVYLLICGLRLLSSTFMAIGAGENIAKIVRSIQGVRTSNDVILYAYFSFFDSRSLTVII